MFLKSISLTNILSFGDKATTIGLKPLNILIGHNGSGKSNLIECISVLQAAPINLAKAFWEGSGIADWLWKGSTGTPTARIEVVINESRIGKDLRYGISFTAANQRFHLLTEIIEEAALSDSHQFKKTYFSNMEGRVQIASGGYFHDLPAKMFDPALSVLAQRKDPVNYPEITWLGESFGWIYIYRDWSFGHHTPPRLPQQPDMPTEFLLETLENLGLILNNLRLESEPRKKIINNLRKIYPGAEDFGVSIQANSVQVVIHEEHFVIPASRLSDGTLRFLCLLAILCHPNPPPLVCIEEPELGLHPDMMPVIADLLRDAATRTQLIVTTHSDLLVEQFTDEPESVLTFEKRDNQTTVHRLDSSELSAWLEKYTLGQLRQQGHIAGNRW